MKEVYFDTNVYSHLLNRHHGITNSDCAKLFEKIKANKVRVYLSSAVLEETMGALLEHEKEALARLRLMYRIVNRKRILKTYIRILHETITAYAKGHAVPSYFTSPGPLNRMMKKQNEVDLAALRLLTLVTQDKIDDDRQFAEKLYSELRPQAKEEIRLKKRPTLEHYWDDYAIMIVEKIADISGALAGCRERGIEGLLNFAPMKAVTAGLVSQWYANAYDKGKTDRGDNKDLNHAIYGAAIGTLVTHDTRFSNCLKRLPIDGLEIMDLHTLLSRI